MQLTHFSKVPTHFRRPSKSSFSGVPTCNGIDQNLKANWSAFYSSGPEILQNLEHIVDKYTLRPYIKLRHRVVSARYSEESGKWLLTIKRPRSNIGESLERNPPKLSKPSYDDWEEFQDTADVLFTGVGALSRWDWPDIEGLETFAGQVIHSAHWETGNDARRWEESIADWGDKKVGVIGIVGKFSPSSTLQSSSCFHPGIVCNPNSPFTATKSQTLDQLCARQDLDLINLCERKFTGTLCWRGNCKLYIDCLYTTQFSKLSM